MGVGCDIAQRPVPGHGAGIDRQNQVVKLVKSMKSPLFKGAFLIGRGPSRFIFASIPAFGEVLPVTSITQIFMRVELNRMKLRQYHARALSQGQLFGLWQVVG